MQWQCFVKSFKSHLCKVVGGVKLNYEEMSYRANPNRVLHKNSCPLTAVIQEDDRVEALTPAWSLHHRETTGRHFPTLLITLYISLSLLHHWRLCQTPLWHLESVVKGTLNQLTLFCKMAPSLENLSVGDVFVVLKEDNLTPTKWLIARVVEVDPGTDGLARVVTVKMVE